jgi:linoleoyl-CoA desaturase
METCKLSFEKDHTNDFFHELKARITPLLNPMNEQIRLITWTKILLFPALYMANYSLLIGYAQSLKQLYAAYALFGVLMPLITVNIVHDAIHGCLLKSAMGNFLARHLFEIIGGNSFVWQKRHVVFHHPTPNVIGWDIDIESRKLYTLSDADEHKPFHQYQHLYMPIVFPLFTLHWVLFRDFKDYYSRNSMFRRRMNVPTIEFVKLPFFKAIYILHIVVLPAALLEYSWYHILSAFVLLHIIAAVGALIILLPNHWDEDAEFQKPESSKITESWAFYQLRNTNDFAIYNPIANFLMGGLNHHVAHHLFPGINHNYLPTITKEVIKIARERGLPYKCFSLSEAVGTHFRLLKKNGLYYGLKHRAIYK